jgi:hypothetical protein
MAKKKKESCCVVCSMGYEVPEPIPYGYHFCEDHIGYLDSAAAGTVEKYRKTKSERDRRSIHAKALKSLKRGWEAADLLLWLEYEILPSYQLYGHPLRIGGSGLESSVVERLFSDMRMIAVEAIQDHEAHVRENLLLKAKLCPICEKGVVGKSSFCGKDAVSDRGKLDSRRQRRKERSIDRDSRRDERFQVLRTLFHETHAFSHLPPSMDL